MTKNRVIKVNKNWNN